MKKQCSQCKKQKNYSDFNKDKRTKDGLYSECKSCSYEYQKNWRKKNRVKIREYRKNHREHNKIYHKKWMGKNREVWNRYCRNYEKQKRKTNPKFRIDSNLSSTISMALKGKKAGRKWENLVGYTSDELTKHLEAKFKPWMLWENYGKWHIDHIIPKSHLKYKTAEDPEFKKCWALENLQPLEAIENIRKRNKLL